MRIERTIAIQHQLENNINDLFSQAKMLGYSSAEMSTRFHAFFERYPKTLPNRVRTYARGYYQALWNALYKTDLVHGYIWQGKFFQKWDEMPETLKEHIRSTPSEQLDNAHFWKRFVDKQDYRRF